MFRIVFGFVLGVVACFYALPMIEGKVGEIERPELSSIFSKEDTHYPSNIINATPPVRDTIDQFNTKVAAALAATSNKSLDDATSDYVVRLITDIVSKDPQIADFVSSKLDNGLTNREALAIFERYFDLNT